MTKRSYTVELRSAPLPELDDDVVEAFADAVLADRRLAGATPSADLALRVLELRTGVDAASLEDALDIAIAAFERASRRRLGTAEADVVDAAVWLEDATVADRHELLSGAEVAEKLGVSRQRVQQLASMPGRFPEPVKDFGTVSVWRWGDVQDWIATGGRGEAGRMTALAAALGVQLSGKRNPEHRDALVERLVDLANAGDKDAIEFLDLNPELAFKSAGDGKYYRQVDSGRGPGIAVGARGSIVRTRRRA